MNVEVNIAKLEARDGRHRDPLSYLGIGLLLQIVSGVVWFAGDQMDDGTAAYWLAVLVGFIGSTLAFIGMIGWGVLIALRAIDAERE